jgi:hypothetical protein
LQKGTEQLYRVRVLTPKGEAEGKLSIPFGFVGACRDGRVGWQFDYLVHAGSGHGPAFPLTGRRGRSRYYSDVAIETGHLLPLAFGRPWRQTEGLLRSIANLLGVSLAIPDHNTFSRRITGLSLTTLLTLSSEPAGPAYGGDPGKGPAGWAEDGGCCGAVLRSLGKASGFSGKSGRPISPSPPKSPPPDLCTNATIPHRRVRLAFVGNARLHPIGSTVQA